MLQSTWFLFKQACAYCANMGSDSLDEGAARAEGSYSGGGRLDAWREITDRRVLAAFERVPREAFVPHNLRRWANRDAPLPIGYGQTISQPFVVAVMSQALGLESGERVLEIGAGSGFQTAILCELTAVEGKPKGETVYTVERFARLAQQAQTRLVAQGYFASVHVGDGALGWPEHAPYDAILVTAAAWALPLPLWSQLREGGRMVIPIGPQGGDQQLWRLRKVKDQIVGERLGAVRFVPLLSPVLDDPDSRVEFV
jgi:protein-L-isoaspartate(D-aspartate) O-methyltransferase